MIKWYRRRKYRKFIKESFKTVSLFVHECRASDIEEIIEACHGLLDDYRAKYGDDDIYLHYLGRLKYFKYVKRYKEHEELKRKKIEE